MEKLLDANKLLVIAEMLKALAHPLRIAIVEQLSKTSRLTVTSIYQTLDSEQAVVSHHLRIMRDRGILNSKREGKQVYYSLRHSRISQIIDCIEKCRLDREV